MRGKVLEWIKKTGFPLEMEAANAFRAAGFEVRQSSSYVDPHERKGREIDVLAIDPDLVGVIEISFVLECKSSTKPWVVLVTDDALANYNRIFAFAITSKSAKKALVAQIADGPVRQLLKRSAKCGFGFRQALGGKDDRAYAAATGAVKACAGLVVDRKFTNIPRLAFAFPVIVVDSPVFECSLIDGKLDLAEVEASEFLFSAYLPDTTGCCVKVIKRDRLADFAVESKTRAERLRRALKVDEQRSNLT